MRDSSWHWIESRPTLNFLNGRGEDRPRAIVVHTTAGTADGTISWFASAESGVSAHYLVRLNGTVVQFVDEADSARHAGRVLDPSAELILSAGGDPNLYTIGIEFEDGGDPGGAARTDEQYAAGARLIARAAMRWEIRLQRDRVIGHREIYAAKSCPGNLEVDRLLAEAAARPRLACLLAVRNGAEELPGYLDSVGRFADAVIALDDGSTDATAEVLDRSLLVQRLVANPRREGYEHWDDAANRQRLLEEAAALAPEWVLFLDVDERIDPEDGLALRRFVGGDALPGCSYALQLHRMWGEEGTVPGFTWVHRLFAFRPGLQLPRRRLHFDPVPEEIPEHARLRTSIRVRHLDSPARLEARRAKYSEADPAAELERRPARLLAEPEQDVVPWRRRDEGLPVLDPTLALTDEPPDRDEHGHAPSRLVVLLPVRNAETDIPGYLESVERFADAVIALDDGSSDSTRELLESSPLVERVLEGPPREGYGGWDDRHNRQRLLDAAENLGPDWVLFLDADERIDPGDGDALRTFLDADADPGCAYGFRVFRMIDDLDHYDSAGLWVYRLFGYRPGQELPDARLHFVTVPVSVLRRRWRKTTIRIQHLASLTAERRATRYRKYQEADPECRYQHDYSLLLRSPGELRRWSPRPAGFPALADPLERGARAELDLETLDPDAPALSAIVISRDDEQRIERCLRSVTSQECPQPFEVIVVTSGTDGTAEIVRREFPQVRLVELPSPALPGAARNAGLRQARGDYVSFPGSHVELPPGSLAARLRAHENGHAMVTGTVLNGTTTGSGWASYFLDHSGVLPGRPSEELVGPPAHCSYVREFLLEVGGFPEDMRTGEDTVVNRQLARHGRRAYRAQDVHLIHASPCRGPLRLARHHFRRGRGLGRILVDDHRGGPRLLRPLILRAHLLGYIGRRLRDTSARVERWGGDLRGRYKRVKPLVMLGIVSAWAGLWFEILRPGRGKLAALFWDQGGIELVTAPPRRALRERVPAS